MSVLVNGSPTKEFLVERGLRQGDPLSPFLFVIVAEGLKAMVNKAVENGDFVGFSVKGKCFIDVLQFADDTLLVGDGSWKNLWAIKAVLKGGNPKRIAFWNPLVDNVRKRLSTWKGRWLSFGGRMTLLKSVLGSLPIFTLSFYLAPKKVVREINRIQSHFLWGGVEEKKCIHWVRWEDVCTPIDKGGLGLKNLEVFNIAILCKWKWRILEESNSFWYRMLKARYGDIKLRMFLEGGKRDKYTSKSDWWSDILSLDKKLSGDFFTNNDVSVA
ncbi:uncharacterized protein LOC131630579 [Vicia villosa]|uniref:uncharacterized protein LOC131630579 n=1 Tax=Vicia villosa TaxID=3911 RepID=UPI00273B5DBB|nr:uncharacterized protein LOC131630579 [Vicia villosa]